MRVAIHQPNYFPWLGFWRKLAFADIFILLDTVEYTKGGYINRTQIHGPQGPTWLTIPVHAHLHTPITEIWEADATWPQQHRAKLAQWYATAPYAHDVLPVIDQWLAQLPQANLATINESLIRRMANYLGVTTRIYCASELGVTATERTARLVELCRAVSPTPGTYLTGAGGLTYLDPACFHAHGWQIACVQTPPSLSLLDTLCAEGKLAICDNFMQSVQKGA